MHILHVFNVIFVKNTLQLLQYGITKKKMFVNCTVLIKSSVKCYIVLILRYRKPLKKSKIISLRCLKIWKYIFFGTRFPSLPIQDQSFWHTKQVKIINNN